MKIFKGQSIVEVIISVSILVIIASTAISAILGSFSSSRLAREETKAAIMASEGLEAVTSIRNQSWSNLTNGNRGLAKVSNVWSFSGISDTDASGRYTRVITISDVFRDTNGNIVTSGGTLDPDTKKILSSVSWNFSPTRTNTVDMTLYLTNWSLSKSSVVIPASVTTCSQYCQIFGNTSGTCRGTPQLCTSNGEIYRSGGNVYCTTVGISNCCCLP